MTKTRVFLKVRVKVFRFKDLNAKDMHKILHLEWNTIIGQFEVFAWRLFILS